MAHEPDADGEQPDYYATLNVPRGADDEDVRRAYLALSRAVHPDKQRGDETLAAAATEAFQRLERAYRVLSTPALRQAFDQYGELGVRLAEGGEAADVLAQYEGDGARFATKLRRLVLDGLADESLRELDAGAHAECRLNVFPLLFKPLDRRAWEHCHVDKVVMRQNAQIVSFGSNKKTSRVPKYRLNAQFIGGLTPLSQHPPWMQCGLVLHRDFSADSHASLAANAGARWGVQASVARAVSQSSNASLTLALEDGAPTMRANVSRALDGRTGASIGYALSHHPDDLAFAPEFGAHRRTRRHKLRARAAPGAERYSASAERALSKRSHAVAKLLSDRQDALSLRLQVGRKLSDTHRVRFGIQVGLRGVCVLLSVRRGNVTFDLPLLLSPGLDPVAMLVGSLLPSAVVAVFKWATDPAARQERAEARRRAAQEGTRAAAQHAASAAAQQRLMQRRARAARDAGDLVVLAATYGCARHEADVAVPMQFFVRDGRLALGAASKAMLLGFHSPCAVAGCSCDASSLWVRYQVADGVFEMRVQDDEPMVLPSARAARVGEVGRVS